MPGCVEARDNKNTTNILKKYNGDTNGVTDGVTKQ
jgi:hypothetical protein